MDRSNNTHHRRSYLLAMAVVPASIIAFASPVHADQSGDQTPPDPTWSVLSPPSGPPGLHDASEAYDADNQTVVLFGGVRSDGTLSDATWVWNGSTWSQAPTLVSPPARQQAAMAYDPSLPNQPELILFGGLGAGGTLLNDTWAWNGASWSQVNATTSAPSPPARADASMAEDANGDLVLFGGTGVATTSAAASGGASTSGSGASGPGASASGTSASSGGSGTSGSGSGGSGSASTGSSGTGTSAPTTQATGVLSDTWVWNGSTWSEPTLTASPPARTGAALTWDPMLDETVLFGGTDVTTGAASGLLDDTWTWDGTSWTEAVPTTSPPARTDAISVFAAALGGDLVATGETANGPSNDTWTFDGTTWTELPAATPMSSRQQSGGAWDAATSQVVLFGGLSASGSTLADTVVLTATAPVTATSPPASTPSTANNSSTSTGGSSTSSSPASIGGASTTTSGSNTTARSSTTANTATTGGTKPTALIGTSVAPSTGEAAASTNQTVHDGSLVTLTGSGFKPRSMVTITFHSTPYLVGRVRASAQGSFSATVTVPTGASVGQHHLVAAGLDPSGKLTSLVTPIRVVSLSGGDGDGHRLTTVVMVGVAVLLPVGTWTGMWLRGRRRGVAPAR
jgi:hypothetical protein